MNAGHLRKITGGRGWWWLAMALVVATIGIALHRPMLVAATTFTPNPSGCLWGTYTVPSGIRYLQVVAIGGAGGDAAAYSAHNTGGSGGGGANVTAIIPVSPGEDLRIAAGQNGDNGGSPNGGAATPHHAATEFSSASGGKGGGGGTSAVTTSSGDPCFDAGASRDAVLVVAGGGGGGGGGNTFGSGGNGGSAGGNTDFSGQGGSDAYHASTDCGQGSGGGGGSPTAAGNQGAGGCVGAISGSSGSDTQGGNAPSYLSGDLAAGGAGGGGWYGGGSGGSGGGGLGGGGGGAGSSYITSTAISQSLSTDTTHAPSVTITPLPTPTTSLTLGGTTSGNNWFTSDVKVTLSASDTGGPGLGFTVYALDKPDCAAGKPQCFAPLDPEIVTYTGPFTVSSNGFHTLTFFSGDTAGLTELIQNQTFTITHTSATVSSSNVGSGADPTATTGGKAGALGSVSATGSGSGQVGVAVYNANPAGAPVFSSSGAYIDVIAAGSGLSSLTITDCNLNGGTTVDWWNGTAWALASIQTYDPARHCVTITVNSTTVPSLSQLTGTPFAAGSPPTITAAAKTADGKPYTAGTWTNQSVTVTFTCSPHATPSAPVTRANDGANQSADGTCTDGVGTKTSTTFPAIPGTPGIDVDKTPPTCSTQVSPNVLWPPNSKLITVTGTVTVGDNLSGVVSVVGGAVTSNEALAPDDVQGFAINTVFGAPPRLSAVLNITGALNAKRNGVGRGRTYSQTFIVKDRAGNTNSTPCTWTVTAPQDQGPGR